MKNILNQKGAVVVDTLLGAFRVLDLSDEKGYLCGKIMGELGADVIKIEPPGGESGRGIGPFYKDVPDPEKSLYWMFWNDSKRSITLDIQSEKGRKILLQMVEKCDFLIHSFPCGYMEKLGLSYPEMEKINPRLIVTAITPFGQTGPYRFYKTSELVSMATAGPMKMNGDPDRPPLRMNPYHGIAYAGAAAFAGSMIAHYHRQQSGEGQFIDVSMQEASSQETFVFPPIYELTGFQNKRMGMYFTQYSPAHPYWMNRWLYPCKDGWVCFALRGGHTAVKQQSALTRWMTESGMEGPLKGIDWVKFDPPNEPPESVEAIQNAIAEFFKTKTKEEIETSGRELGTRASAILNAKEVLESKQYQYRHTFQYISYPGIKKKIPVPGQLFLSNLTSSNVSRRPPLIGEHNEEIYCHELGMSGVDIEQLKSEHVI
jgi:crotonobetainyl-CoA:carnitine CoA-transferase CaiB-like acyl-CoA transferase